MGGVHVGTAVIRIPPSVTQPRNDDCYASEEFILKICDIRGIGSDRTNSPKHASRMLFMMVGPVRNGYCSPIFARLPGPFASSSGPQLEAVEKKRHYSAGNNSNESPANKAARLVAGEAATEEEREEGRGSLAIQGQRLENPGLSEDISSCDSVHRLKEEAKSPAGERVSHISPKLSSSFTRNSLAQKLSPTRDRSDLSSKKRGINARRFQCVDVGAGTRHLSVTTARAY
jgi:hypothetical protein